MRRERIELAQGYVACLFFVGLLMLSMFATFPLLAVAQPDMTPVLYIDPELAVAEANATFSVGVSVANVSDLCSWQVYIYFLRQFLEASGYSEGPFLKSHGPTIFDGSFSNNFNSSHGELWMYCLRTWSGTGVNGSGSLANVTFKAKIKGITSLNVTNTVLGNSTAQRISHTVENGIVQIGGHDVAVIAVAPVKTIVGQGFTMKTNVTVENQGTSSETFDLTLYSNSTAVDTQVVSLTEGETKEVTLTWNTTGFLKTNYTMSAYAWPVNMELDVEDNNMTSLVSVRVVMRGDIVEPFGKVDMKDVSYVARRFGLRPGDDLWDPIADVNDDNKIDMKDVGTVASNFGQIDP